MTTESIASSLRTETRRGATMSVIGAVTLLACSTVVRIDAAVTAPGQLDPEGHVMVVTHPSGGVLSGLLVSEGSVVTAGQPLVRLDDEVASAGARSSTDTLSALTARTARLVAERDGSAMAGPSDAAMSIDFARERRQFDLDAASRADQRRQLLERISSSQDQEASLLQQADDMRSQSAIADRERSAMRTLWDKRLVSMTRYDDAERAVSQLHAQSEDLRSRAAQTRSQRAEYRQSLDSLESDARAKAASELAETTTRLAEARARSAAASDARARSIIRSPVAGVVDSIAFRTPGSAIPAGTALMRIVPATRSMTAEIRIPADRIGSVTVGEPASFRVVAVDHGMGHRIDGTVTWISADRSSDERTGAAFYSARITPSRSSAARLDAVRAGGAVEAAIVTENRSLISYLTRPFMRQFERTFAEA